jgi:hypothetical protein
MNRQVCRDLVTGKFKVKMAMMEETNTKVFNNINIMFDDVRLIYLWRDSSE